LIAASLCATFWLTVTGPPAAASEVNWGPLAPVAYGSAQLDLPVTWPVVPPGSGSCRGGPGPAAVPGVVLLGVFGSSSWCSGSQAGTSVLNIVRLGPLPAGEVTAGRPKVVHNGVTMYTAVLHGRISGTVYLVPSLGVELMATGPARARVLSSIGPSVRERALASGPMTAPPSWHRVHFAGLVFASPATWEVTRSPYLYDCGLQDDDIALSSPPSAVLDTDTNDLAFPCPYLLPPRVAANGLVVDAGSGRSPTVVPAGARRLTVNGLDFFIDQSDELSVLVVVVKVPGRAMPVEVHIGLGDPLTVDRVLGSIEQG